MVVTKAVSLNSIYGWNANYVSGMGLMGQEPLNIVLCNETLHIFHGCQFKEIFVMCKFVDGCMRKLVWQGKCFYCATSGQYIHHLIHGAFVIT